METLTARQRQIYNFISERIHTCGYAPTIREIGAKMGIRSTNGVADHLKALRRKGVLVHQPCKSRTLQLVTQSTPQTKPAARRSAPARRTLSQTVGVPVLGRVAGGQPLLAEEHPEDILEVDRSMLPRRGQVFALHVVGNSMIGAGILDGDTLFVQKTEQARRGAIVVVTIDNEATVKRYYPEPNRLVLRAANPDFADIVVPAAAAREVRLVGLVTGVFRHVGLPR